MTRALNDIAAKGLTILAVLAFLATTRRQLGHMRHGWFWPDHRPRSLRGRLHRRRREGDHAWFSSGSPQARPRALIASSVEESAQSAAVSALSHLRLEHTYASV
jgi:hypothetical protein